MADPRHARGLVDTSVVIDLETIDPAGFPAATAVAGDLPLYTRNPDDFAGLSDLLDVVPI